MYYSCSLKIAYNSCTIYDQMHQHIDSKNVDEIAEALIEVYKMCKIQLDNLNSEIYSKMI